MKINISKYYTASERKTILSADEDPSLTQHIQTETIHMIDQALAMYLEL